MTLSLHKYRHSGMRWCSGAKWTAWFRVVNSLHDTERLSTRYLVVSAGSVVTGPSRVAQERFMCTVVSNRETQKQSDSQQSGTRSPTGLSSSETVSNRGTPNYETLCVVISSQSRRLRMLRWRLQKNCFMLYALYFAVIRWFPHPPDHLTSPDWNKTDGSYGNHSPNPTPAGNVGKVEIATQEWHAGSV